jgi:hypothetical protein
MNCFWLARLSWRALGETLVLCAIGAHVAYSLGDILLHNYSGLAFASLLVFIILLIMIPFDHFISKLPYRASFIYVPILYWAIFFAFGIYAEAVDRPSPILDNIHNLVEKGLPKYSWSLPLAGSLAMFLLVFLVAAEHKFHPKDNAFYPRIVNLWRNLRMLRVRLLLYIGIWVLLLYNAFSVLMIRNLTREHYGYAPDLLFPSVFIMCNLMWSLLWVADCSTRPDRGTVVATGGFLCLITAFFIPLDFFVFNM